MYVDARLAPAVDEDLDAVVVIAAPPFSPLEGPPARDNRSRRHGLLHDLPVHAVVHDRGRTGLAAVLTRQNPLVQALPTVPEAVVRPLVRAGDEAVERHGHVQDRGGHEGILPLVITPRQPSAWPRLRSTRPSEGDAGFGSASAVAAAGSPVARHCSSLRRPERRRQKARASAVTVASGSPDPMIHCPWADR